MPSDAKPAMSEDGELDADRDGEDGGDEEVFDDDGEDVTDDIRDVEEFADFGEDNVEADEKEEHEKVGGAAQGPSVAMLFDMEEVMLSVEIDDGKSSAFNDITYTNRLRVPVFTIKKLFHDRPERQDTFSTVSQSLITKLTPLDTRNRLESFLSTTNSTTMGLLDPIYNVVNSTINGAIAGAGAAAGDTVSGVGGVISSTGQGIGDSVTGYARNWGDYAKDTGNYVKDYTKAPGPRVGTAANPLGLAGNQSRSAPLHMGTSSSKTTPSAKKKTSAPEPRKQITAPPARKQIAAAPPAASKPTPVSSNSARAAPKAAQPAPKPAQAAPKLPQAVSKSSPPVSKTTQGTKVSGTPRNTTSTSGTNSILASRVRAQIAKGAAATPKPDAAKPTANKARAAAKK
ncbi:60S ribosomal protein L23A [Pseudocyphellaria aurata]|nr:60S ribosomal protein L23A [Pseudocyphellaria aurata]